MNSHASEARRAATVTMAVIALLMVAKAIAGHLMQSIALGSEALHTLLDLATALLAYLTIRAAMAPADLDHPYGHGKIENLMALIQAAMIIAPAGFILWFSGSQLLSGTLSYRTEQTPIGLWTMAGTMAANFGLMVYLGGVAKRTGSPSIRANATHERVDLITSVIVFAGMVVIALTGLTVVDPLLGIASAIYIFKEGWDLGYDSVQVLLDHQAPQHLIDRIHAVLHRHGHFIHTYSNVRTRLVGSQVHAEVDIQVCRDAQLGDVHDLTDHLEAEFERAIPGIDVHIHPEPCPPACSTCPLRDHPSRLFTPLHTHTPVPEPLRAAEEELEHQAY